MKDFLTVFFGTTMAGVLLGAFVYYIFYLASWGHNTVFFGIVALFAAVGILLALVATYFKVPSRWLGK